MFLKKLEASGFKSFAERVVINFTEGLIGFVGPNGSGKSNVNDAIRWVLGEQSLKALRGGSSEDIIFSGSEGKDAAKKATVTLTFDNSKGLLNTNNRGEIKITRVVKRGVSGNEYYIDGEPSRLSDIHAMIIGTGLGKNNLSIISQGSITKISDASHQERRKIFEEVSGVSRYRKKKEEALRKLEKITQNLDIAKTSLNELKKQVIPLQKAAEKAKIYLSKRDELEKIEIALIVVNSTFYKENLAKFKEEIEDLNSQLGSQGINLSSLEKKQESLENMVSQLDEEISTLQEREEKVQNQISAATETNAVSSGVNEISKEYLKEEGDKISVELQTSQSRFDSMHETTSTLLEEKSKIISELNDFENKSEEARRILQTIEIKYEQTKMKLDNSSTISRGSKTIMSRKDSFPGIIGLVAEEYETLDDYKIAIFVALRSSQSNIIIKSQDVAQKAIKFLRENRAGTTTFLPLDNLKSPYPLNDEVVFSAKKSEGFIGVASELIKNKSNVKSVYDFLLSRTLVAKDFNSAKNIFSIINKKARIVTLDGDVFNPSGSISGGFNNVSTLKDLREILGRLEKAKEKQTEIFVNSVKEKDDKQIKIDSISSDIESRQTELSKLEFRIDSLEGNLSQISKRYYDLTGQELKIDKNNNIQSITDLYKEFDTIKTEMRSKIQQRTNFNEELITISRKFRSENSELSELKDRISELKTNIVQLETKLENDSKILAESYNLTIETAIEKNYKLEMDVNEAQETVGRLRFDIQSLGSVDVDSIERFEETNKRFEELGEEVNNMQTAQNQVVDLIDEMDKKLVTEFDDMIKKIRTNFQEVFKEMFGGGAADLKYSEPENMLDSGIEIIAQPPGKVVKRITLFSGGEKSLITISLLFAILKTKPIPFVILDEAEAALDEANVEKYANYCRKLNTITQVMVVTHRPGTMERCEILYGVTMQAKGVTSLISVDLERATKMID